VAERDQAMQIVVERSPVRRTSGYPSLMLAALGQHDAKRARGDFGVLKNIS